MMQSALIFAAGLAAASLVVLIGYRAVWIALRGTAVTPTGAGALLSLAFLLGAVILGAPREITIAFAIVVVATLVYWIDDLIELSARLRLALSFITGISLCLVLGLDQNSSLTLLLGCGAAGIVNVVLTNIVNFYDGADLNLATFICLTGAFVHAFAAPDAPVANASLAALAFVVPFAILNSRPKTIYLGDAGSFAFACFLTMLAILYFSTGTMPAEIAIPLALPALDTCYVFCIRIIEKHDLMTRNYLHLYQKLNGRFFPFAYLLPQIVNAALVLAAARTLQRIGVSNFMSVAIAGIVVTAAFYLGCRKLLLPPRERGSVY